MNAPARSGRGCSRVGCRLIASMTLTYIYSESTAVIGPLATFSEPHAYDLCETHGKKLTVPNGWSVMKEDLSQGQVGPSEDDLMAIADAVREVASNSLPQRDINENEILSVSAQTNLGRRGHLRAVPSQ
jgi:hypothetical protein